MEWTAVMPVNDTIQASQSTCVLVAPAHVEMGKHMTDAVREGGWTLLRTAEPIEAFVALCEFERVRRAADKSQPVRHMLLIHRDMHVDVNGALQAAVRKHIPGLKVHEIQGKPTPGSSLSGADLGRSSVARASQHVECDADSPVVGRIGRSGAAAARLTPARVNPLVDDAEDEDGLAQADHEVTRDEISMLLAGEDAEERR